MKLSFVVPSLLTLAVTISLLPNAAFALGPSVSGGVPPAPRGVVILAHATAKGVFDEVGLQAVLTLAASHVAANRVLAFTQREDSQANDRKYICVEYRDFSDFSTATNEFKNALVANPSVEVVANSGCR